MNNSEFQLKISQADKPIIIDFWAPWCVPCRITKPILEKLAQEYATKVEFLAVNADEAREVLDQFRITGIPTVLGLREGKIMGRVTGAQNENGYRTLFESLLKGDEVQLPLATFDRVLRFMAGTLLIVVGISTSSAFVLGIGGIVVFLGVYDRCPIWNAIMKQLKKIVMN